MHTIVPRANQLGIHHFTSCLGARLVCRSISSLGHHNGYVERWKSAMTEAYSLAAEKSHMSVSKEQRLCYKCFLSFVNKIVDLGLINPNMQETYRSNKLEYNSKF